ncbi:MAG: YopX family protein [Lachnospiraceae bacterium]|nr:YopX family protein [Lachnospiraceae bacterium]
MNREILFRGKCVDEWFYGDLLRFADTTQIWYEEEGYGKVNVIVNPETVGQYTGKELDGEKLFTGDIVETCEDYDDIFGYPTTSVFNSVVIWDDKNFCYALKTGDFIQPFNDWNWDNCRLIDNIHDNPELIG